MVFSLFQNICHGKKGQLAVLLVVLLVALLIFAFVSVNLGRLGLQRTRTSNAADAAVLAAGSVASQLLNYMAGYNEMMLLNMSGFVTTVMLAMVLWIIDFVRAIIAVVKSFVTHFQGNPATQALDAANAVLSLNSLMVTSLTIALLVEGATKVGESLEKRIKELNPKLPEDTRNNARQYAFNNAGIDEPKIDYEDWLAYTGKIDSNSTWLEYLNVESTFGAFMRTLSNTNKNDTNFGPNNMLSFSWQDKRRAGQVNNTVEVYTTPMQPLYLESKDFGDVASDSSLRDELNSAIDNADVSSAYQSWIQTGITLAPMILVLLQTIRVLTLIIAVIIAVLAIVTLILFIIYVILCAIPYTSSYGCPRVITSGIEAVALVIMTAVVSSITAIAMVQMEPQSIPCLVYGNDSNDLTVSAEIRRSATPVSGNLDYGLWRMQYPTVTSFSKALADGSGGGKLFPPVTDYNPKLIQTR